MTYTLWLKIENDDGQPNDKDEGWCALTNSETRSAIEIEGDRVRKILGLKGYDTDFLEGWHQGDEEE